MLKIPPYFGLWFLQIFSILFPMVVYQSFFQKRFMNKRVQIMILTLLCSISIIICMAFPVSIEKDYTVDFSFIPLIFAFVFCGFRVGLALSVLLIGCQYAAGFTASFSAGLWTTVFLLFAFGLILPPANRQQAKWKEYYPYILLVLTVIFYYLGAQFLPDDKFTPHEFILWICFSLLNVLTLWMIMYLQKTIQVMESVSEKIIQFEKNRTLNQLLIAISQQLLVPLQTAIEMVGTVHEEQLTVRQAYDLRKIEKELHQAQQSLNQYLRIIEEKQEIQGEWNFVKELEEIIQFMTIYANRKQVKLCYLSTAQEALSIKGEYSMIRFTLVNIIKNAIDACEPQGNVNISLHEMLKEVYVVIEDNGIGLPANFLSLISHPLQTMKENGKGLGLASTFKIAESIGGRVEVESKPNEGTTFSLYFPKWALSLKNYEQPGSL